MKKTLFMETTQVEATKTAAEITACLVNAGARQIAMEYNGSKTPSGLAFVLVVNGFPFPFKLPVRVEPVFKIINGRRTYNRISNSAQDRGQAEKVAWRQLLRWIQAQLAMIETGMVASQEVFLPYMQDDSGKTVYEAFSESRFKALPAPEKKATT